MASVEPAVLPQIATLAAGGFIAGALLAPLFGWRPRESFSADPADAVRPDTELRSA